MKRAVCFSEWKPEQYTDEYREALEKMIEEKIEHGRASRQIQLLKNSSTLARALRRWLKLFLISGWSSPNVSE
jgi:non-homologous end joining protein Ku